MSKKPNVVFILSDQHNAKVLGHKNHPNVKTPNLDRLAGEGVRFDNAITQNPICTPSRMCFLSGQYCHNHGYYALSGPNPRGLPTMPGHFRRAGYTTAAIGKIHCPEYWIEDDSDFFRESCHCSINGRPEYDAYLKSKGLLDLEDHGALQEFGDRGRQTVDARASKLSFEDSQEGWIVGQTIEFMSRSKAQGSPFFAHVSLPKPHQCYAPSEPFWSMYDESALALPPNADYDLEGKAPHMRETARNWRSGWWPLFEPKTFEAGRLRKLHGYLGSVSHIDHAVGLLMQWLKDNNLEEDTIVVYSSDHGDYACEHGIMEKAPGICADAITRIPFIWRWKGAFAAGHKADEIVETVDVSATLCALAGLPPMETSDGKDISRLLEGKSGEVRSVGVTEFAWSKSVRKGRYRCVFYPREMFAAEYPDGFGELYDLESDPWEMKNLYFDPKHEAMRREMRDELLDWLVTTTRPATVLCAEDAYGPQTLRRYKCAVNHDHKMHPDRIRRARHKNYV